VEDGNNNNKHLYERKLIYKEIYLFAFIINHKEVIYQKHSKEKQVLKLLFVAK